MRELLADIGEAAMASGSSGVHEPVFLCRSSSCRSTKRRHLAAVLLASEDEDPIGNLFFFPSRNQ
jgi:hypothetical protein